ncbi:MAG: beta-N-acetylhexosaminidase [Planctomycetota bacterium]
MIEPTPAARHFIIGLPGMALDDSTRRLLDRGVSGVILFSRNVQSPEQVAELVRSVKAHAGRPVLVGVDQEGGRVARLREGFTPLPSMRELGRAGGVCKAKAVGAVLGRELRAVGINVAFAPVLDVDTNPANPVIGDRSLGAEPKLVAELGTAVARGIQSAGVAACGKHFPGHGDTSVDSHQALPRLTHDMQRLQSVELLPFRAAIADHIPAIMTSHIVFEALDPDRPATVSPAVIDGLLRQQMGFNGIVFTDCMQMRAIADAIGTTEAACQAVKAGVDLVLISHDHDLAHIAIDRLASARAGGELDDISLAASAKRIDVFSQDFANNMDNRSGLDVLNCDEHRLVVERLIDRNTGLTDPTESN